MAEYLENEVPGELLNTAKSLRKTERKVTMLEDSDVIDITAGYRKEKGYASGFKIECPICGRKLVDGIDSWENSDNECSVFHCRLCDITWGIDKFGRVWEDFF